jgi:hypothetical protein
LVVGTAWWWGWLGGGDGLVVGTAWWWGRLDGEDGLVMRTIYLSTLNWADKEFFLTFLYIASLGQAWQNPSDTNPKVGLRALISPTRSDTNPRVGFELLSETQPYGQATYFNHACNRICIVVFYLHHHDDLNKSMTSIFSIEIVTDSEE